MNTNPYETPRTSSGRSSEMRGDMRLTLKSLFKLLFIGFLFGLGPIILASGLYALITGGESMVNFNGDKLRGLSGFIGTIIFIPIMSTIFASVVWVFISIGSWLYTRIWDLNLEFKEKT